MNIPRLNEYENKLDCWYKLNVLSNLLSLLDVFVKLNASVKYSNTPRYDLECALVLYVRGDVL